MHRRLGVVPWGALGVVRSGAPVVTPFGDAGGDSLCVPGVIRTVRPV